MGAMDLNYAACIWYWQGVQVKAFTTPSTTRLAAIAIVNDSTATITKPGMAQLAKRTTYIG